MKTSNQNQWLPGSYLDGRILAALDTAPSIQGESRPTSVGKWKKGVHRPREKLEEVILNGKGSFPPSAKHQMIMFHL